MAHYFDTSALVKFVVAEPESTSLREWLRSGERRPVTSDLARTELMRVTRRIAAERLVHARLVLDSVDLIGIAGETFDQAGRLEPVGLRTLDAAHLAVALALGDDLEGMVTYDERLAAAATANGVRIVAPR